MAMTAMVMSTSAIMVNSFGFKIIPRRETKGRKRILLSVPGINCQSCVDRIRDHLITQKGIQTVEGDPIKKIISVAFIRGEIRENQIKEGISQLGYTLAD